MPTRVERQGLRSDALVLAAVRELNRAWPQVDWDNPAAEKAVMVVYGGIVRKFGQATASLAAMAYDEDRKAAGATSKFIATPAPTFPQAALEKAVTSAFLGNDPEKRPTVVGAAPRPAETTSDLPVEQRVPARLGAQLQRHVMQPARDTVAQNAAKDPLKTRYIRVPRGASTCAFCIMLASRDIGPTFRGYASASVRTDKETGLQYLVDKNGEKYHNGCDCEAVPLFGQHPDEISPHFYAYRDLYEKAAAEAGTTSDAKKVLASLRRLGNDGALAEGMPDVRDRAGENNQRATPITEHAAESEHHDDVPELDDAAEKQSPDHPVNRQQVHDQLDELDDADDDYADLGSPDDVGEPGPKAPETKLDAALRQLSEAMENGADDDEIDRLADLSDKLQDQADKAAARRQAAKDAFGARVAQLIEEDGEDPQVAEATALMELPANVKKAQALVGGPNRLHSMLLERIRRRDFMAQARADGNTGADFEKLVWSVFHGIVNDEYDKAEAATNGRLLKRKYEDDTTIDYKDLWYLSEKKAKLYMSDEMAAWFDQNGRMTQKQFRTMILDGETTYQRHREDYLQ